MILDAPLLLLVFLPLSLAFSLAATWYRARVTRSQAHAGNANREPEDLWDEIEILGPSSHEPGTFLVAWDAANPVPTGCMMTGLIAGTECHVRMPRLLDESDRELPRVPWTPLAKLDVASELEDNAAAVAQDAPDDYVWGVAEVLDGSTCERIRAFAIGNIPRGAAQLGNADYSADAASKGHGSSLSFADAADLR